MLGHDYGETISLARKMKLLRDGILQN